jgi:hypothetical protein
MSGVCSAEMKVSIFKSSKQILEMNQTTNIIPTKNNPVYSVENTREKLEVRRTISVDSAGINWINCSTEIIENTILMNR